MENIGWIIYLCGLADSFTAFFGIIGALFNLGEKIDNSNLASTYNRIISFLTEPLSPMILLCIGAELEFELDIFKKAVTAAASHFTHGCVTASL